MKATATLNWAGSKYEFYTIKLPGYGVFLTGCDLHLEEAEAVSAELSRLRAEKPELFSKPVNPTKTP